MVEYLKVDGPGVLIEKEGPAVAGKKKRRGPVTAGFRRRRHLLMAVTVKWGSVTAAARLKRRDLVTAAAGSPVTAVAGLRRRGKQLRIIFLQKFLHL